MEALPRAQLELLTLLDLPVLLVVPVAVFLLLPLLFEIEWDLPVPLVEPLLVLPLLDPMLRLPEFPLLPFVFEVLPVSSPPRAASSSSSSTRSTPASPLSRLPVTSSPLAWVTSGPRAPRVNAAISTATAPTMIRSSVVAPGIAAPIVGANQEVGVRPGHVETTQSH
jgi:hypothetical protein